MKETPSYSMKQLSEEQIFLTPHISLIVQQKLTLEQVCCENA